MAELTASHPIALRRGDREGIEVRAGTALIADRLGWSIPDPTAMETARRGSPLFSTVVIAAYAALGIAAYWPLVIGISHRVPYQSYGDSTQMVWFFGWTAHAVATGHNPFFSTAANVPYGVNMAQLTFVPLLGALFAPLTLLAGPVSSVAVCFVAAMPLSAASAYAVLRYWRIWAPAAAIGGLAYGFSPYMLNQGIGHLNLVFLPLPPVIVAALVNLLSRPRHPLRWGAALGGLVVAQFLISSEILAITAVVSVAGLFIAGAYCLQRHPDELAAHIGPAVKGAGAAVAIAGAALSYPIWFQFAGPQHYSGPTWGYQPGYSAHVSEFVAPTPHQLIHPAFAASGARYYAASFGEDGAYLGLGALLVVAALVWLRRRSARVRLTAILGMFAVVLSFGPYTYVNRTNQRIALPFHYLAKLPAVGDIVPLRFSFATAACLAALLAFGLDGIHREAVVGLEPARHCAKASRWGPKLAAAAVCLVLVVTWVPSRPFPVQSVTALPSAITSALPGGDPVVLAYPYPLSADNMAMVWQARAGFSFRLIGVYARVPRLNGHPDSQSPLIDPRAVQEFLAGEEVGPGSAYPAVSKGADVIAQTRDFMIRQHVGAVLVSLSAANAAAVVRMFSAALGPPSLTAGGFELWVAAR